MNNELEFEVEISVPSHKNNYRIVNKRLIRTNRLINAAEAIALSAKNSMAWRSLSILPKGTEISLSIVITVKNKRFTDIDGVLTTIMDALEGVVYENDRDVWCANIKRIKGDVNKVSVSVAPRSPWEQAA